MLDLIHATVGSPGAFDEAFDPSAPFGAGIMLHGFGATGDDLAPLSPLFPVREQWLFPHAPGQIEWGGMLYGRAWFPREKRAMEAAMTGAYFNGLREQDPPGLSEAAGEVFELAEAHGVAWEETLLGGFSQGAMVAVEVALRAPTPPKGLLLFSGSLIAEKRWSVSAEELSRAGGRRGRFFQSHGKSDQILPFEEGRALFELLRSAGWEGSFVGFRGGHEIPPEVAREAYHQLYTGG
ncbi:MAG: alpha/beta hydrolase [Spirochaetaceae bacterium]